MAALQTRRQLLQAGAAGAIALTCAEHLHAKPEPKPLPARQAADGIDGPPVVTARAWTIVDGRTGRYVYGGNERAALAMASTTKIMTAYIVFRLVTDNAKVLDETVVVSEQAARTTGSAAQIRTGDRIPVRDLLFGLLLPSGNDAAVAVAQHFGARLRERNAKNPPAPLSSFVEEMNRQAGRLKLGETRYLDPHGLGRNQTSARDLTALAYNAMQIERFREYVRTRRHRATLTNVKGERRIVTWNNTNKLLDIEGYDGIKTGTTTAAGSCLVASGRRGEDHLLITLLGCTSNDSRYADARNLFRWAWRERAARK